MKYIKPKRIPEANIQEEQCSIIYCEEPRKEGSDMCRYCSVNRSING